MTNKRQSLQQYLNCAKEAVRMVGPILKTGFRKKIDIQMKGNTPALTNIVTSIDRQAQRIIIKTIALQFPHHSFLGEESVQRSLGDNFTWIIDPLDGTLGYSRRILPYSTAIALVYKKKPLLAVVYNPETDELFWAVHRKGAWKNGKRMNVSKRTDPSECTLLIIGIKRADRDFLRTSSKRRLMRFGAIGMPLSSSIYEDCLLADGRIDGIIQIMNDGCLWDYVAPCLMIEEAGGKVTRLDGQPWTIVDKAHILSNGYIHNDLVHIAKNQKQYA